MNTAQSPEESGTRTGTEASRSEDVTAAAASRSAALEAELAALEAMLAPEPDAPSEDTTAQLAERSGGESEVRVVPAPPAAQSQPGDDP